MPLPTLPEDPPRLWPTPPTRLRDTRSVVTVGRLLGSAFAICLVTGVFSHLHQHPVAWFPLPTRPASLFRWTQGIHVAVGLAAIPLLLTKLWTVYPRLFTWPPARTVVAVLERLSIAVLVSGAIFELTTGLLNILQWYPWKFGFIQAHWWVAWLTIGALLLHIAVKLPLIAAHWRKPAPTADESEQEQLTGVSRRSLITAGIGGAAVVTVVTVGQSARWFAPTALLAPRTPGEGAGGVPINRTAAAADVVDAAQAADWVLTVVGSPNLSLTLAQLRAMPQTTVSLPIACVEGWSVQASWTGVRLSHVLDAAGTPANTLLRAVSLEQRGGSREALVAADLARDPLTLLALQLEGEELSLDHGWPCRLIAPGRPGVAQTKWLSRIEAA
jgi:DMSO/TMAO reductase YedYZ molybdopterin-dependent catalytic subunit